MRGQGSAVRATAPIIFRGPASTIRTCARGSPPSRSSTLRDAPCVGYEALMRSGPARRAAPPRAARARGGRTTVALDLAPATPPSGPPSEPGSTRRSPCSSTPTSRRSTAASPSARRRASTLLVEVTEQALIARPEATLRALTRLRSAGWGIALDDVGADSRSLALMSVLYPDVIKLDLRLLGERRRTVRADRHRGRGRGGAPARGRARGRHRLRGPARPIAPSARRSGRDTCSARRRRCRTRSPPPGARAAAGRRRPVGATPWDRVTNWRRPSTGSPRRGRRA